MRSKYYMLLSGLMIAVFLLHGPVNAQVAACEGAPLTRLAVGESGEIAPNIDRLRLRALPAVGTGEVRLLHAGNPFEVIAGPSCNGGYTWWRVALEDGTTGWVAEGTWESYFLRPVSSRPRTLCQRAEIPWLHLAVTAACNLLGMS